MTTNNTHVCALVRIVHNAEHTTVYYITHFQSKSIQNVRNLHGPYTFLQFIVVTST